MKKGTKWRKTEVFRDRMVTGIAIIIRSAHVLPHLGQASWYLSELSYFFKINAGKALFFLSCSVVHFFFSGSSVFWVFLITLISLSPFGHCLNRNVFPVPKAHMWFLWTDPKLPNLSSYARAHSQLNIFFPWNWAQKLLVGSDVKIILKTLRPNSAQ